MSNEYWEAAFDEIATEHGIIFNLENIAAIASDLNDASIAQGESMPPVYHSEKVIVNTVAEPKSSCCEAEIINKKTGYMGGNYNACSRCQKVINII